MRFSSASPTTCCCSSSNTSATALTFMGSRIEGWPADRKAGLEFVFSRVTFKATAEWKE